jgi:dihydrofolate synthase/folylpolyglutamate synthase
MGPWPSPEDFDLDSLLPPFRATDPASRWLFGLERLGMRPGLERIEALLEELGHPERSFESVVIAGTNGKGTAATYFAALSRASGLRTGLYTSPHLLRIHERVLVDGVPISAPVLGSLVEESKGLIEATGATFFETTTALALLHFARAGVELAVLETGLGGRLDATNAVDARGTLLTSVGLDHQHVLGESLREIAFEKLGLAKRGRPYFLGPLEEEIREFALQRLELVGAEAVDLGGLPPYAGHLAQRGRNQARLAAVVRACYEDLARRHDWPLGNPENALAETQVPCRYQVLSQRPELILDTAHNAPALATLLEQWGAEGAKSDRVLVLGVMRDKRVDEILARARRSAGLVIATAPRWYRSRPAEDLHKALAEAAGGGDTELRVSASVREALEQAREWATGRAREGGVPSVLVTGSNFTVAEALDRLGVDDIHGTPRLELWESGKALRRRDGAEGKARIQ